MNEHPQLWMLVGGNGSGKTTFYQKFLKPYGIHFINADLIAREMSPDAPEAMSYEAAQIAEQMRLDLVHHRIPFCFETVFSHPSKIEFVQQARMQDYEINMVFIHLGDPQLNIARISQRVVEGGHFVPDEKVTGRLKRLVDNVKACIPLVDRLVIFDNSQRVGSFNCQLEYVSGTLSYQAEQLEPWTAEFLLNQ